MKKDKKIWTSVLVVSTILLIGYGVWGVNFLNNGKYFSSGYDRPMTDRWYGDQVTREKLSVDQVMGIINDHIKGYGSNLQVSDIFVYKDSDYYVSVEEKDTGRGAMELLVNPYTGEIYPEYGPSMMWNEKYGGYNRYGMHRGNGMHGGYGMMGDERWNMMDKAPQYNYKNRNITNPLGREQAIIIADNYVKDRAGDEFSVTGTGHEFYGYFTFHIELGDDPIGMISVNSYTGEPWYHDWHGELVEVISNHKE